MILIVDITLVPYLCEHTASLALYLMTNLPFVLTCLNCWIPILLLLPTKAIDFVIALEPVIYKPGLHHSPVMYMLQDQLNALVISDHHQPFAIARCTQMFVNSINQMVTLHWSTQHVRQPNMDCLWYILLWNTHLLLLSIHLEALCNHQSQPTSIVLHFLNVLMDSQLQLWIRST